jgi:hypothetical protein
MEAVDILRPNVSLKEARELLTTDGFRGWLRYLRLGHFRWLAHVYVPFDVFSLEIFRNGMVETGAIALDAVNGTLDPYSFEHPPTDTDCITLETRNALPRVMLAPASQKNAEQHVRRLLYQRGFFRISNLEIKATRLPLGIYVPYWVGFYGCDSEVRLEVVDAVRRRMEGAKVRVLMQQWLTGEFSRCQRPQPMAAAS